MFDFLKRVSDANTLRARFATGELVTLERGEYDLDFDALLTLNVRAANPTQTRVRVHQPLRVGYWSRFTDVSLIPQGDFAAGILDHAAYSVFERVIFGAPLPVQAHIGKRWNEVERKGIGIETTGANDGDNSYACKFRDCVFDFLERGVNIQPPASKGTVAWVFENAVFNGCRYPVIGARIADWQINYGNVQLAECGICIDGNNNRLLRVHFERSKMDVFIAEGSYYNHLDAIDAPLQKIEDWGIETRVEVQKKRNIGRRD